MVLRCLVLALSVGFLAACATPTSSLTMRPNITQINEMAEAPLTNALSPRILEAGQCGLFLFTRAEPARLIFFYSADAESADYYDGKKEIDLNLEAAEGEVFGQFYTAMTFSTPDNQTLEISYDAGDTLQEGARTRNARIIVTDSEGWEMIIPVAGVRACQPDNAGQA